MFKTVSVLVLAHRVVRTYSSNYNNMTSSHTLFFRAHTLGKNEKDEPLPRYFILK